MMPNVGLSGIGAKRKYFTDVLVKLLGVTGNYFNIAFLSLCAVGWSGTTLEQLIYVSASSRIYFIYIVQYAFTNHSAATSLEDMTPYPFSYMRRC